MSDLIEELKRDHRQILMKLEELSKVDIIKPEGHQKVLAVRDLFMNHIKEEDSEFYPILRDACKKDSRLNELVSMFDENMKEISDFAMEFFNKYLKGAVEFEFKQDFKRLLEAFRTRIRREECVLYEEFEKVIHGGQIK